MAAAVDDYFDALGDADVDPTRARGANPEAAGDLSSAMASYAAQPRVRARSGRSECRYGDECRLVHSVAHRQRFDHPDPVDPEAFQPFVVMAQEQGGIPASGTVEVGGRWLGYQYQDKPFVHAVGSAMQERLARL